VPSKGDASRSSRNVGAGCNGRCGVRRVRSPGETSAAYGEVVWSWRRDRGVYPVRPCGLGNGDKKRRSPGRARSKPLNIAWGRPGRLGCTCGVLPMCFPHMGRPCAPAHGIYGRGQRPAFPAPSLLKRDTDIAKPGRKPAAGTRSHVLLGGKCTRPCSRKLWSIPAKTLR
jgi:hypothetical protein